MVQNFFSLNKKKNFELWSKKISNDISLTNLFMKTCFVQNYTVLSTTKSFFSLCFSRKTPHFEIALQSDPLYQKRRKARWGVVWMSTFTHKTDRLPLRAEGAFGQSPASAFGNGIPYLVRVLRRSFSPIYFVDPKLSHFQNFRVFFRQNASFFFSGYKVPIQRTSHTRFQPIW